MDFLGGFYKPTVFADGGNIHDRWTCGGKLSKDSDAKIDPIVVGTPTAGLAWDVIIAVGGFAGEALPTLVGAGWGVFLGDGTSYGHPEHKIVFIRYPTS
jgi:hypothetical protein